MVARSLLVLASALLVCGGAGCGRKCGTPPESCSCSHEHAFRYPEDCCPSTVCYCYEGTDFEWVSTHCDPPAPVDGSVVDGSPLDAAFDAAPDAAGGDAPPDLIDAGG